MSRCLYCYKPLVADQIDWHPACSKRFFGHRGTPVLDLNLSEIIQAGLRVVAARTAVAGVQRKLSVDIEEIEQTTGSKVRLSVNVGDRFILKPPVSEYPALPELEDATMHLARQLKIDTADHALFRFQSGELGYLTRRFDRGPEGEKWPMEDFCQITERLAEAKYKGSIEQVARALRRYSVDAELDAVRLLEQVLFSFITGNADMHLKNFSLLTEPVKLLKQKTYRPTPAPRLSPAYDLVPTILLIPSDPEETALALNGKRSKLTLSDFYRAASSMGIEKAAVDAILKSFAKKLSRIEDFLATTFISPDTQRRYAELVRSRLARLAS